MTLLVLILAGILAGGNVGQPAQAIQGDANYADPSHGRNYLAMRLPRGTVVTICGAGSCRVMTTTDYGPAESTGDVADIALKRFAPICGYSIAKARRMGECHVVITFGDVRLPATDTAP